VVVEDEDQQCPTIVDGFVAVRFRRSGISNMPKHRPREASGPLFQFNYIIYKLIQ